jgi:hypothetical protein
VGKGRCGYSPLEEGPASGGGGGGCQRRVARRDEEGKGAHKGRGRGKKRVDDGSRSQPHRPD